MQKDQAYVSPSFEVEESSSGKALGARIVGQIAASEGPAPKLLQIALSPAYVHRNDLSGNFGEHQLAEGRPDIWNLLKETVAGEEAVPLRPLLQVLQGGHQNQDWRSVQIHSGQWQKIYNIRSVSLL
jgi:hypothetical protein